MKDLASARMMWLKGILFLVIGAVGATLIIAQNPALQSIVLLLLTIWAFCRAYYFAFYVIEHYVDPSYRFSGLWSFCLYCLKKR